MYNIKINNKIINFIVCCILFGLKKIKVYMIKVKIKIKLYVNIIVKF